MEPPVCAPPESLLKHDEPLFVGFDGNDEGGVKKGDASGSQLEEMVNSMLPPRVRARRPGDARTLLRGPAMCDARPSDRREAARAAATPRASPRAAHVDARVRS